MIQISKEIFCTHTIPSGHYRNQLQCAVNRWNLIQKAFAQGWQIHNVEHPWGTDYYTHGTCLDCDHGVCDCSGYVPTKAQTLILISGGILPNSLQGLELAHFAIAVAIDLLLVDHKDHALVEKLLTAALFRPPEDLKLLNYYGSFYKSALYPIFQTLNNILARWASRKYKRLRGRKRGAHLWLQRIAHGQPCLFAHWQFSQFKVG